MYQLAVSPQKPISHKMQEKCVKWNCVGDCCVARFNYRKLSLGL